MYDPNKPRLNSGGQVKPGMNGAVTKPEINTQANNYIPPTMPTMNQYGQNFNAGYYPYKK